jgi:hypothetical protein
LATRNQILGKERKEGRKKERKRKETSKGKQIG